jgi:hypothetical protein
VEIHDHNKQLSFKVFAPDGAGLLEVPNLLRSNLRDERLLDAWLDDVRAQIASLHLGPTASATTRAAAAASFVWPVALAQAHRAVRANGVGIAHGVLALVACSHRWKAEPVRRLEGEPPT